MFETTRQKLARLYPLHFQTIVERMYEAWHDSITDMMLERQAGPFSLATVFAWDVTPEGHVYWSMLSSRVETP